MGEARWQHLASVTWVPDHVDAVVSDLSVLHRVDDATALSSARFFVMARRLPHYPGAVRFELQQQVDVQRAAPPVAAPEGRGEEVPQVRGLDEARALRDRIRRARYPEAKWGAMTRVGVAQINSLGVPGG